MNTVFFTHIPKTAGTSVRKAVFNKIVSDSQMENYSGMQKAFMKRGNSFKFLKGHYPFGVHKLYSISDYRYYVILRDPVDRAISYYYFVKACDSENYKHPNLSDVKDNTLVEFYSKCKYQNIQTRFVAGISWNYIGGGVPIKGLLGRWMLNTAKKNLINRYEAYGLKEYLSSSIQLFESSLGVNSKVATKKFKKTPKRPDLQDLDRETIEALKDANSLDIELYRFAVNEFKKQFS